MYHIKHNPAYVIFKVCHILQVTIQRNRKTLRKYFGIETPKPRHPWLDPSSSKEAKSQSKRCTDLHFVGTEVKKARTERQTYKFRKQVL